MPLIELVEGKLWEYENFLSQEEVRELMDFATFSDENTWFGHGLSDTDSHFTGMTLQAVGDAATDSTIKNINIRLSNLFSKAEVVLPTGTIVRNSRYFMPVGPHRDNEDEDMNNNRNANCKYGILMYLNDNFNGGEICYPELGIEYKPKPGVLLIHDAGNLHSVNPVTEGVRYSMISFAWGMDTELER